jgi:pimeloyl-ACP methyl ester carboxylesterase
MEIPHIVKMTPVPEQTLPIPVLEGFDFLSGIQIDLSGALFKSEPKLSVPAPVGLPADATPFLARLEEIDGQMEYVIVNSAQVENGRITTHSPPFDGVLTSGIFLFLLPPPAQIPVVLTGRVYKDGNANNLYDPENISPTSTLKDLPVRGAVVRVKLASAGTFQLFPAVTNSQGVYALYALASASDWNGSLSMLTFEVNATDPLSRASQSIFLSGAFDYFNATATDNRDVKLLDLSQIPDITPPSLDLRVQGARYFGGTTEIGQPLNITLSAVDSGGISSSNISLSISPTNDTFTRQGVSCTPGRCDVTYRYTPQNTGIAPYLISLQATVQDDQGNRDEKRLSLSAGLPGTQLQPDPTRAPSVIDGSIEPPNHSIGVPVDQIIRIGFSEPVNASASNLILRGPDGLSVDADYITRSSSGQYIIEIRPRSNLRLESTYQIEITDQITDNDPSPRPLTNPQVITFTTTTVSISAEISLQNARDEAYFTTSDGRKYLLVSNDGQGVALIDVSHPSQPRKIVDVPILSPPYGQTYGVAVSDQAHYTDRDGNPVYRIAAVTAYDSQTGFGTIWILAIDDPAPGGEIVPRVIGSGILASETNGVPFRVVIIDKYAYVATLLVGIQIVDIEKAIAPHLPGANILAGAIDTTAANDVQAWPTDIKAIGTHVFAVTQRLGASSGELIAIEGADSLLATIQGRLPFAQPNKLAVAGSFPVLNPDGSEVVKDLAFVSNGTQLQIVDVTDITTLTYFSQLTFQEVIRSVAVDPDHRILYIGQGVATILVVDLRDTRNPRQIGAFALGTPGTLLAESGVLYVAGGTNGLMVAQLSPGYIHFRAADQSPVIGAVTDGATQVEVILEGLEETGQVTFTLEDVNDSQLGGIGGWVNGNDRPTSITVTAAREASDGVIRARAKYEVPQTFVRFGEAQEAIDKEIKERVVRVTAKKGIALDPANPQSGSSNQTVVLANEPLTLQRPPVLLVHGVWSDKDVWGPFESLLQGDSKKFITVRADYSQSPYHNAGPFSQNYPVIPEYIEKLLGRIGKRQLAATKVDVVVHSMGGLLVREYCRQESIFGRDCSEQIHKLITVDTPHNGSEAAKVVQSVRDQRIPASLGLPDFTYDHPFCQSLIPLMHQKKMYTNLGAVDNLASGSLGLQNLSAFHLGVPSHSLTGLTSTGVIAHTQSVRLLWIGLMVGCGLKADQEMGVTADQFSVFSKEVSQYLEQQISISQMTVDALYDFYSYIRDCVGVLNNAVLLGDLVRAGIQCVESANEFPQDIVNNTRNYLIALENGSGIGLIPLWAERNDRIVSGTSQGGGLAANASWELPVGVDHLDVHQKREVTDHVKSILEQPLSSTDFEISGFGP